MHDGFLKVGSFFLKSFLGAFLEAGEVQPRGMTPTTCITTTTSYQHPQTLHFFNMDPKTPRCSKAPEQILRHTPSIHSRKYTNSLNPLTLEIDTLNAQFPK